MRRVLKSSQGTPSWPWEWSFSTVTRTPTKVTKRLIFFSSNLKTWLILLGFVGLPSLLVTKRSYTELDIANTMHGISE